MADAHLHAAASYKCFPRRRKIAVHRFGDGHGAELVPTFGELPCIVRGRTTWKTAPPTFDEVAVEVEKAEGVHFRDLFNRSPSPSPTATPSSPPTSTNSTPASLAAS